MSGGKKTHSVLRRKDLSAKNNYLRDERAFVQWTLICKKRKGQILIQRFTFKSGFERTNDLNVGVCHFILKFLCLMIFPTIFHVSYFSQLILFYYRHILKAKCND